MQRTLTLFMMAFTIILISDSELFAREGTVKLVFSDIDTGENILPKYEWHKHSGSIRKCDSVPGCRFSVRVKLNDNVATQKIVEQKFYLDAGKYEFEFTDKGFLDEYGRPYTGVKKILRFEIRESKWDNIVLNIPVAQMVRVLYSNKVFNDIGSLAMTNETEDDSEIKICDFNSLRSCDFYDQYYHYYIKPGKYTLSYFSKPISCYLHGFNPAYGFDHPGCPFNGDDMLVSYVEVGDAIRMETEEIPGSRKEPSIEFQICEAEPVFEDLLHQIENVLPCSLHERYPGESIEVVAKPGTILYIAARDM